ncbi:MAG: hypothetical protein J0G30_08860 [Actinomycetales bacterium]|nr:hypothetical protein [Actinomycetales bacterium]
MPLGRIARRVLGPDPRRTLAERALFAGKSALAAALSWWLAPLLPFTQERYAYYAALGALIAMTPTVLQSTRSGLQVLVGATLGIAIGVGGLALLFAEWPEVAVIGLVIAVGVLIGGVRQLGTGRSWAPIAALFVVVIGRADPTGFTLGYLADLPVGIVVGLAVNALIVPPLYLRRAQERLSELRHDVGAAMHEIADAIAATDEDPGGVRRRIHRLSPTADAVRAEVERGDESRRLNPRAARRRSLRELNRRRIAALDRTVLLVRDTADLLDPVTEADAGAAGTDASAEHGRHPSGPARDRFARTLHATAELVETPPEDEDARGRLDRARAELQALREALDAHADRPSQVGRELAAVESLGRIIDASQAFVD